MIGLGSTVGNYRVIKKLGSGAMGAVYLAEHPTIGKKVALKVIHSDLAENEEMLSRFFNEARAVTQIGHSNIVEVIDFGQSPDGDNFIVMELLEGRSLGDVLKERPILPLAEAIHIATQIADGLEASHQRGIIHRDLKPDNVYLITRYNDPNYVKILDFGLAKLTQGGGAMSHKTRAGSVLGTPHYMAPEQAEGKPDIDHRVDVYALGCIMFQMLCGRVPFPGEGFGEVLVKHLREPPQQPTQINPDIPKPIEKIILHALAKRKEFRVQSMKEMGRAMREPARYLRELEGDSPIGTGTGEGDAPPVAALQQKPKVNRPVVPVVKADDAAPTMLDELPPDIEEAIREARQANEPPREVPKGAATVMLDAGSLSLPSRDDVEEEPARPARRGMPRALIAVGAALLVAGVAAVGMHFLGGKSLAVTPRVVVVSSDPSGAEVSRDGAKVGSAPVVLRLVPGSAPSVVKLHKEGFLDAERVVDGATEEQIVVKLLRKPVAEKPEAAEDAPAGDANKGSSAGKATNGATRVNDPTDAPTVEARTPAPRSPRPAAHPAGETPRPQTAVTERKPRPPKKPVTKKSLDDDDILVPNF